MAASTSRTGSWAGTRARSPDFGNSFSESGNSVLFYSSASPVVLMGVAGGGIMSFEVLICFVHHGYVVAIFTSCSFRLFYVILRFCVFVCVSVFLYS